MDNYDSLICTVCGGSLRLKGETLSCTGCGTEFRLVDGIPVFGAPDQVEKWTRYHTDDSNYRHKFQKAYITDEPATPSKYYSSYIQNDSNKVLDVGGGDGVTSADWAITHPQSEVYVMDLSLHGLVKSKKRKLGNHIPVCSPADSPFPFRDRYFDTVMTVFMVEHLDNAALSKFGAEVLRVLKDEGRLIVATDSPFYDKHIHPIERLLRRGKYVSNDPTHINLMEPHKCTRIIEEAGFRIVDKCIHWIAGRYAMARWLYRVLPGRISERYFSTMYVLVFEKNKRHQNDK